jgi:signal transduction histidine kinase
MSSRWSDAVRHALPLRLGLWYAGLFTVGSVALLVVTYSLLSTTLARRDHDVLEDMLARYRSEYQRAGFKGLDALMDADEGEGRHERLLVRVVGPQTELQHSTHPPSWGAFDLSRLDDPAAQHTGWMSIESPDDRSVLEVGTARLADGLLVQVGRSSRIRDELLANFRAHAIEVAIALVLLAVGGGIAIAYGALAPVRDMQATAGTILRTRRYTARVPTRGTRDPLDQLGERINEMLAQIETLVGGMKGALDNVAHDLRTPLTRLRNVAESALTSGQPGAAEDALARAVEEADRVGATLTALMDVSEAEAGTMRLNREHVALDAVVREAMALHEDEADDRRLALTWHGDPALTLWADRTRMRQVVANLIENAVKYTEPGGSVAIDALEGGGEIALSVRDTGIGIAPEHLPLVWDRLYRADPARSPRGLGLGLSLVKAIVEAHGGHVSASSAIGGGSVFTVTLPTARPQAPATSS